MRDQCKAREQQVTPDQQAELGLVGPRGPAGRLGPAAGTLHLIDAGGRDVGVVMQTHSYDGSSVDFVGEMTLQYESVALLGDPDQTLCLYTAEAGSPSETALRLLANWTGERVSEGR